jgi:hypothetical protein
MQTTTVEGVVAQIPDGASLIVGRFMGIGTPELCFRSANRRHVRWKPGTGFVVGSGSAGCAVIRTYCRFSFRRGGF